jgi:4-hydroxy-tetrahydrodipicolinate synthase
MCLSLYAYSKQIGVQMFTGLSAFPLTPFKDEQIDLVAYEALMNNLTLAKVDSICAMGSTGLYPYLSVHEKLTVAQNTVEMAQGIPVMAGVGALRTVDVLQNVEVVQKAGVSGVLLAPVSYHPLKDDEVFSLYERVTAELSVPLCVYENANATKFTFSDVLLQSIAALPKVGAIKILGAPFVSENGRERLAQLRNLLPNNVSIGVSGDKFGAAGIAAGCDLWLSVLGGLFPNTVKRMIEAAKSGNGALGLELSEQLEGMWELFIHHKGGVRVMATAADILGYTEGNCLPQPLQPLQGEERKILATLLEQLLLD